MTNITYLSIIDRLLEEYKYEVAEDGYTFVVEKKEGVYRFLCLDDLFSLQQYFSKEQIEMFGLKFIVQEVENIFFNKH